MGNLERLEQIVNESLVIKDGFPLPSIIEINPIDSCNRSCSFCPRSNPEIAPNNPLPFSWDLVEKLYREIPEMGFKGVVVFSGYGEPLMFDDLFPAVGLLSAVCKVDVVTNGDYLTKAKVDILMELGLNKLLISVYDEKRNAPIEKMTEHLPQDKYEIRRRYQGFKLTNRAGTLEGIIPAIIDAPCHYPSYSVMLDWNGDVLLCPQDWNKRVKFGNLHQDTLFNIWTSDHMNKFRKELFNGRSKSPCNKCDTNGTLHGTLHKEAWLKS